MALTLMFDKMIAEGHGKDLGDDDEDLCVDAAGSTGPRRSTMPSCGSADQPPDTKSVFRKRRLSGFELAVKLSLCREKHWHMRFNAAIGQH